VVAVDSLAAEALLEKVRTEEKDEPKKILTMESGSGASLSS